MAGGLLDDLDFSKLPWAQPTNASPPPGAVPGDQPQGVLSGTAPTGAPPAPPPDLNEAGFMQAEGPGAGASVAKPGLLSRLMATSPDGITFANKLMAAGSMLKGQGGQAMDYLQQQREGALKQQMLQRSLASKQAQSAAMQKLLAADPRLAKFAPFAQAMGQDFDAKDLASIEELSRHKYGFQNVTGGGLVRTDADEGTATELVKGAPRKAELVVEDPDHPGEYIINQQVLKAQAEAEEAKDKLKKQYAIPRAGGRAPQQKSYANNEVSY